MKKEIAFTLFVILGGLSGCVASTNNITAIIEITSTKTIIKTTNTSPISTNTVAPTLASDSMANSKYYQAECWEKAQSQYDLNICAGLQEEVSYQALQKLLEEIHQKIPEKAWNELVIVQEDWENYRKADCNIYYSLFDGASIAPMEYGICLFSHNVDRINQIKYFVCDGYGLTGPCEASNKY